VFLLQSNPQGVAFWTDHLALAFLESIANDTLVELVADEQDITGAENAPTNDPAAWLQSHSRNRGQLQLAIMRAWRQANTEVVSAAQLIAIDSSAEHCEAMLRQFSASDLLLELITGDRDDGWELASWVADNVKNESVRRELSAILQDWSTSDVTSSDVTGNSPDLETQPKVRVVIFGGHVRDGQKMTERLFEGSPFEVRWRPFEKGTGVPTIKVINEATANSDAALVVTTMVSHAIMQMVKRSVRDTGIQFLAIPKATDIHLTAALGKLFPDINLGR